MTLQEIQRMAQLERAVRIAAEMFAKAGYCTPSGDPSAEGIRRWLLRMAGKELREERPPEGGAKTGREQKKPRAQ